MTIRRLVLLLVAASAAVALAGCNRRVAGLWDLGLPELHGRYAGVGIYTPGDSWSRLVGAEAPRPGAARTSDDQAIIVVVDSASGEVRACGDLSGHCIGLNPWDKPLPPKHLSPVDLTPKPPPQPDPPAEPPR